MCTVFSLVLRSPIPRAKNAVFAANEKCEELPIHAIEISYDIPVFPPGGQSHAGICNEAPSFRGIN